MKTVMKYYKPYIGLILLCVLVLFGEVFCELALPTYMSAIINKGIVVCNMGAIRHLGLIMIGIAFASLVLAVFEAFLASFTAAKTCHGIRRDLFARITAFSTAEFEKFSTASLITRSTNDVQLIQQATVMCLRLLLFAPIMGTGAVIMAVRTSMELSWTIAVALAAVCILMVISFFAVFPKFKVMQTKLDRINLVMKERLSGTLVVRAFRTEEKEEDRFDDANRDLTQLYIFVNKAMAFLMPTMTFIMSGVGVLIVWAGAHLVDVGTLPVGDMLAYLQYAMHVIMSFMFVTMIFILIPRAAVSAGRIGEVLNTEISIKDPDMHHGDGSGGNNVPTRTVPVGTIQFRDVCFRYPDSDEDALSGISFTAEPGKTTAIIGGTGSGKSTLINLIPRFYDVTGGSVTMDGVDVRDMMQEDLRAAIGLVPQKGTLFSGTIESNLRYGDENATREDLIEAAETAQAMEFINEKPKGLEEEVAQGGTNVSGGQKQRLCIARALVKKPAVYIFDDSFSALDFATDKALRKALRQKAAGSTFIIVAQRINTIVDADRIIVLDEGKMVGLGTHEELLKTCDVYKEIALSQLSEEELGMEGGEMDA